MASINIHYPLRPCYVPNCRKVRNPEKGLFHCWSHESEVIPPSPLMGGHNGGVVAGVVGIVELEDGSIIKVYPTDIRFCDNEFDNYAFPEKHDEKGVAENGSQT